MTKHVNVNRNALSTDVPSEMRPTATSTTLGEKCFKFN